jgi:hypothetical protein
MQWRAFKPRLVAWREVEIDDGGKAEGEIGTRNLRAISRPKVWVGVDRVVIQRRGVTRVHVRIDQSRDEESPAPVYPPGMWTGNQVPADFSDLALADNNIREKQRGDALGRDQSDICDYRALINNALRVRRRPNIQNYKRGQRPHQRSIVHDCPPEITGAITAESATGPRQLSVTPGRFYELSDVKVPPVASKARPSQPRGQKLVRLHARMVGNTEVEFSLAGCHAGREQFSRSVSQVKFRLLQIMRTVTL